MSEPESVTRLRRAAALLRQRAGNATPSMAHTDHTGRWEHVDFAGPSGQPLASHGGQSTYMGSGSVVAVGDFGVCSVAAPDGDLYPRGGYSPHDDMAWIATVDPAVGLVLAAWLEAEAKREAHSLAEFGYRVVPNEAHELARLVLREDEGSEG